MEEASRSASDRVSSFALSGGSVGQARKGGTRNAELHFAATGVGETARLGGEIPRVEALCSAVGLLCLVSYKCQ
jgi:hypothetical protein